jgi:hypothetical protein
MSRAVPATQVVHAIKIIVFTSTFDSHASPGHYRETNCPPFRRSQDAELRRLTRNSSSEMIAPRNRSLVIDVNERALETISLRPNFVAYSVALP